MRVKGFRVTLTVLALGVLSACGGNSSNSGSATTLQGRFVDAPVAGLSYACVSGATTKSGATGTNGEFDYVSGSVCTFKIGGVTVGSAAGASVLTPVQLVSGATDETHPTVEKIVRFLMSLDHDNTPGNGITIHDTARTALASKSLDFTAGTFDNDALTVVQAAYNARTLATGLSARNHFKEQLLALRVGTYTCSYRGSSTGTVTMVIAADGKLTGTGRDNSDNSQFSLSGSVLSNGGATVGTAGDSSTFSGTFTNSGQADGTWSSRPSNASGTWSCTRNT
jgi:hypothetical protein